jgi:hypothetical protein
METLLLYTLATTAFYYLGYKAMITRRLWSWYAQWPSFSSFMGCSACAGTWYGFVVGALGQWYGLPFFGITAWWSFFVVGICTMVTTPFVAALHDYTLRYLDPEPPSS